MSETSKEDLTETNDKIIETMSSDIECTVDDVEDAPVGAEVQCEIQEEVADIMRAKEGDSEQWYKGKKESLRKIIPFIIVMVTILGEIIIFSGNSSSTPTDKLISMIQDVYLGNYNIGK